MVSIYDFTGKHLGTIVEPSKLVYKEVRNGVGSFSFSVKFNSPADLELLAPDHIVYIDENKQGIIETLQLDKVHKVLDISGVTMEAVLDWKPALYFTESTYASPVGLAIGVSMIPTYASASTTEDRGYYSQDMWVGYNPEERGAYNRFWNSIFRNILNHMSDFGLTMANSIASELGTIVPPFRVVQLTGNSVLDVLQNSLNTADELKEYRFYVRFNPSGLLGSDLFKTYIKKENSYTINANSPEISEANYTISRKDAWDYVHGDWANAVTSTSPAGHFSPVAIVPTHTGAWAPTDRIKHYTSNTSKDKTLVSTASIINSVRSDIRVDCFEKLEWTERDYEVVINPKVVEYTLGDIIRIWDEDLNLDITRVVSEKEYIYTGQEAQVITQFGSLGGE